ncbi:MAG: hypothetical protein JJU34_06075 [Lunatimonas sp.]|nr:hypothetical protein [Lunatimonas sp.]
MPSPTPFQAECLQGLDFQPSEDGFLADSLSISEDVRRAYDTKTIDMILALNLMSDLQYFQQEDLEPLDRLTLQTEISRKILKMNLELQSLMSAIDCEEEKAEQIASFLDKELRRKERNLTVTAIITGAVVGVGTGFMLASNNSQNDLPEYLGIAGGLTEVLLGLSILRLEKKVSIHHPKNILRDVYEAKERPPYFPPATWYYFNSKNQNDRGISLRQQLIERWEAYHMDEDGISVLLSEGGDYSSDLLKIRSEMLDQLESQISLINKDLLNFLNQIR